PWREKLPSQVFDEALPIAEPEGLRKRLAKALELLQQAGYTFKDGTMVNADSGSPLNIEILLYNAQFERVAQPLLRNLARLGIKGNLRIVDVNQYLNRLRSFDFDMVVGGFPQSLNPGNEQREYWGSEYADRPQSRNLIGLQDPVIDALVDAINAADTRESLD